MRMIRPARWCCFERAEFTLIYSAIIYPWYVLFWYFLFPYSVCLFCSFQGLIILDNIALNNNGNDGSKYPSWLDDFHEEQNRPKNFFFVVCRMVQLHTQKMDESGKGLAWLQVAVGIWCPIPMLFIASDVHIISSRTVHNVFSLVGFCSGERWLVSLYCHGLVCFGFGLILARGWLWLLVVLYYWLDGYCSMIDAISLLDFGKK